MKVTDWFKGFEKGISCLDEEQRATFFAECGKNCVNCGTLHIYQELYEKAKGDLDVFFLEAAGLPGVNSEVIEKGSAWNLFFLECTCPLHHQGYVSTPLLCECSKQSILFVMHSLWKEKKFQVTICESVLRGGKCCRMRVEAIDNAE